MKKIKHWFFAASIREVQGIPAVLMLLTFLQLIIVTVVSKTNLPQKYSWLSISLMLFLIGIAGIVGIIRREFWMSQHMTFRGSPAVIVGVIVGLLGIAGGVIMLIGAMRGY